jgi:hypothetical protein
MSNALTRRDVVTGAAATPALAISDRTDPSLTLAAMEPQIRDAAAVYELRSEE